MTARFVEMQPVAAEKIASGMLRSVRVGGDCAEVKQRVERAPMITQGGVDLIDKVALFFCSVDMVDDIRQRRAHHADAAAAHVSGHGEDGLRQNADVGLFVGAAADGAVLQHVVDADLQHRVGDVGVLQHVAGQPVD